MTPAERAEQAAAVRAAFPTLPHGRAELLDALRRAATTEEDLSVSRWADLHRKIAAESGSRYPGDWSTDRVPYLREPMDCLHPDHPARSVRLKFSAQTGKSEVGVCWFGFIVDRAPGSMLTMLPSLEEVIKYNRVKLQPTIDASPRIRARVAPEKSRDERGSTMAFKRFGGGFDQIVTASSSKGLQMVSIRYLIMEEVSEYPADTGGRGSPIDQGRARQKSYGALAKEFVPSTPGLAGDCRISAMFDDGDRRRFYLPCPHCGTFHVLRWENMQPPSPSTNFRVTFACPANGCLVDKAAMPAMLAAGRWVPTRVAEGEQPVPALIEPDSIDSHAVAPCTGRVRAWQPSYALWSAYSPFESWGDIRKRGEDARGDPLKEKTFTQQDLGEAYEGRSDRPDHEKLAGCRTGWPRGSVPYPACVLTGFIDVQGNRLEWGVWAFGPGFQAWLVDRGVIAHDHTADEAWAAVDALVARTWPTAAGNLLPVMRWGIDTGNYTQALYDRVSRRRALLATKGDNRPTAAPFKMSRADLRDTHGRPIRGRRIDLGLIGNFDLKSSVYAGLAHLVAGPGPDGRWPQTTVHLPDWIGEDELRQLTAETLVDPRLEARGNGRRKALLAPGDAREWRKAPHQPNEGLDIAVGCRALAWGEGAGQIDAARWAELVVAAHAPEGAAAPRPFAGPERPAAAPRPPVAPADGPSVTVTAAPPPNAAATSLFDRLAALNGGPEDDFEPE